MSFVLATTCTPCKVKPYPAAAPCWAAGRPQLRASQPHGAALARRAQPPPGGGTDPGGGGGQPAAPADGLCGPHPAALVTCLFCAWCLVFFFFFFFVWRQRDCRMARLPVFAPAHSSRSRRPPRPARPRRPDRYAPVFGKNQYTAAEYSYDPVPFEEQVGGISSALAPPALAPGKRVAPSVSAVRCRAALQVAAVGELIKEGKVGAACCPSILLSAYAAAGQYCTAAPRRKRASQVLSPTPTHAGAALGPLQRVHLWRVQDGGGGGPAGRAAAHLHPKRLQVLEL